MRGRSGILSSVNTKSGEIELDGKIVTEKLSQAIREYWDEVEFYRLVGHKVIFFVRGGEIFSIEHFTEEEPPEE